uniref:Uncharacterized protein n=1 Tax=Romanomermis culicivorax TaxID=13658 RepID=A0A915HQ11_ROMCU
MGGAGAVPPLANVRVGVTIPTKCQQKWRGSESMDGLKNQFYGWNFIVSGKHKSHIFKLKQ